MLDLDLILTSFIKLVIVPLLIWGVSVLIKLGNAKIALVEGTMLQTAIRNALSEVEAGVYLAIAEVQSTYVDALKAEGKFTAVEAIIAFDKAVARTKEIVSDSGMAVLSRAAIDINALISAQIEAGLAETKVIAVTTEEIAVTPVTVLV